MPDQLRDDRDGLGVLCTQAADWFSQARGRNVLPEVIEKDFWVTELLRQLTACVLFLSVGGTVAGVGFPSDVTDRQWSVLEPLLTAGKRGPRHTDLRNVINGVLYVAHTRCQSGPK